MSAADAAAAAVRVRPMTAADHPAVLALNERHVAVLSPLDADRLAWIASLASGALVAEDDAGVLGFCLAVPAGTAYDSAFYAWFAERYADFLYLDRIAVGERAWRRGVGSALYAAAEAVARAHGRMTCEVNVRPANDASLAFHRARGYVRLEDRPVDADGAKVVAMLAKEFPAG
ncbi:GNAT family N-acetyltransferase [Patulibacter sp. S7RM1-6]